MILKAHRVSTRKGIKRLLRHLVHGDENERVAFIQGTEADVSDMHADARANESKFCVRHWIISPHESMSNDQVRSFLRKLAGEFGFDISAAVVVEHQKPRAVTSAFDRHWHVLVGEVDPISGRVLSSSYDHVRHELIARWSEHEFGHEFVHGRHSKAVLAGLVKRGLNDVAKALASFIATNTTLPREGFTHAQHQECKRRGIDLPALRAVVKDIWASALSLQELRDAFGSHGMAIEVGDKPGTWIVQTQEGKLVGALHRLAGVRKRIAADFMSSQVDVVRTAGNDAGEKDSTLKGVPALDLKRQKADVLRKLDHLEEQLHVELSAPLPPRPEPISPKEFAKKEKHASDALTKAQVAQDEAWKQVQRNPKPSWWWALWPGKRKRMAAKSAALAQALAVADIAVQAKQQLVANVHFERRRELRLANAEYKKRLSAHDRREKLARERLFVLEAMRDILANDPGAVSKGFEVLWRQAEQSLQSADDDDATDEAVFDLEATTYPLRN
ncbi:relaxase/mobilization nuclease domain-containing protein [Pannonibacter sp. SL95]|uniref:relaxase/mobilization nuclease domain-containing protein n=1 Tax=Pannonibacter sp. SL95 TaxID=2995153 RepID=UPI002274827E|nr:hypothetical protein [Pannonibacter sp. SL95]MCY1705273.1 hypothetical protein [Pannonibacter sp. SL95]